jgi:hypothetical protein
MNDEQLYALAADFEIWPDCSITLAASDVDAPRLCIVSPDTKVHPTLHKASNGQLVFEIGLAGKNLKGEPVGVRVIVTKDMARNFAKMFRNIHRYEREAQRR